MRIDLYGSTAAPVAGDRTTAVVPAGQVSAQAAVPQDTATLSAGSLSANALIAQVLRSAEAREGKVEALRQAIGSGAYTLDPGLIAEAMQAAGI